MTLEFNLYKVQYNLVRRLLAPMVVNTNRKVSDLVRHLNLPKNKTDILCCPLKKWNLLEDDVNMTCQTERHKKNHVFSICRNLLL